MKATSPRTLQAALVVTALLGGLVLPSEAHANLTGFTAGKGTLAGGPRFASDDLDVGLGLNGGYTLQPGVYLGGLFTFYFGDGDGASVFGIGGEVDWHAWYLMFEGGYDFGIGRDFVLRPTAAVGMSTVTVDGCVTAPFIGETCRDDSDSDAAGAIGGQALYRISSLTLGGELRFFFGDFDGVWLGFNVGGVF